MPPKKLQSVIAKGSSAKAAPKDSAASKKTATKASEIDDIFSTGSIAPAKPAVAPASHSKKSGSKKEPKETSTAKVSSTKETKEPRDDKFMAEGSDDDSSNGSDSDNEDLFDEEDINESEEAAIAKLLANKAKAKAASSSSGVAQTKPGRPKVEAVVFNERPAAAAAAAAAAKIQKFKRAREDGPDSDDELEKKGKRRTDDGLRLFDIHDLGIGKGGNTDQCPFDCECCF
ncbi:hypothetical protein BGZ93_007845 [Podila epicladia]|nr:hypothetical protein BGZ92_008897 [Podila epicladia]KAG0093541.1 hypothetical protein BGZ93_007845 [Podila epicladia]